MSEHESSKKSNELFELVDSYMSLGEYGQKDMAKKHPHIDFKKLTADADFMQQLSAWSGKTYVHAAHAAHAAHAVHAGSTEIKSHGGNTWTATLEIVAWIIFAVSFIAGIIGAAILGTAGEGFMAFLILVVSAISAFITLAVMMVFLQMAKDISSAAKDTAEIKELLKNK